MRRGPRRWRSDDACDGLQTVRTTMAQNEAGRDMIQVEGRGAASKLAVRVHIGQIGSLAPLSSHAVPQSIGMLFSGTPCETAWGAALVSRPSGGAFRHREGMPLSHRVALGLREHSADCGIAAVAGAQLRAQSGPKRSKAVQSGPKRTMHTQTDRAQRRQLLARWLDMLAWRHRSARRRTVDISSGAKRFVATRACCSGSVARGQRCLMAGEGCALPV